MALLAAGARFLASPRESSASFEAIDGKSSPKSHLFALGRGWVAKSIFPLLIEASTFLRRRMDNYVFVDPNKQSVCSTIVFKLVASTGELFSRRSCNVQSGPVALSNAR